MVFFAPVRIWRGGGASHRIDVEDAKHGVVERNRVRRVPVFGNCRVSAGFSGWLYGTSYHGSQLEHSVGKSAEPLCDALPAAPAIAAVCCHLLEGLHADFVYRPAGVGRLPAGCAYAIGVPDFVAVVPVFTASGKKIGDYGVKNGGSACNGRKNTLSLQHENRMVS